MVMHAGHFKYAQHATGILSGSSTAVQLQMSTTLLKTAAKSCLFLCLDRNRQQKLQHCSIACTAHVQSVFCAAQAKHIILAAVAAAIERGRVFKEVGL